MQFLKKIILSAASTFTLSACFFLTSCAPKNSCDTLVCQNGGTCAADFCNCPTGFDGPQCENRITDRYIGSYAGLTNPNNGQPHHLDTVDIYTSSSPMTLSIVRRRRPDLIYTGIIQNKNNTVVVADIVDGIYRSVINISLKAPTSVDPKKVLSMNVVDYENGVKFSDLEFNGQSITN